MTTRMLGFAVVERVLCIKCFFFVYATSRQKHPAESAELALYKTLREQACAPEPFVVKRSQLDVWIYINIYLFCVFFTL